MLQCSVGTGVFRASILYYGENNLDAHITSQPAGFITSQHPLLCGGLQSCLSPLAFSTFFNLFPERIMLDCFSPCRNFFCSSRAVRNLQRRINAYQQPWVLNQDALKKQLKLTHPSFLAASGSEVPYLISL